MPEVIAVPNSKVPISILQAKHPEIAGMEAYWTRARVLLEEDEASYGDKAFFIDLPNEDPEERKARLSEYLMGFCNPSQDLVSVKGDYILRRGVDRKTDNTELSQFFARADRSGQSLNDFIRNQGSPTLQGYGTVVAVVDKPRTIAQTKAQELASGMPYLCILNPLQILDWKWGLDGSLEFFRYWQGSADTFRTEFSPAQTSTREYVTWTKNWYYRHDEKGDLKDFLNHNFGIVPVAIQGAFMMDSEKTLGKSTFFSSSQKIFMANNKLSVANYNIAGYGHLLMMERQDVDERHVKLKRDADTNRKEITEATKEKKVLPVQDMAKKPEYLLMDIEIVDKANHQAQLYFHLAAQAEATGREPMPLSGPQGSPQSGISKAYDFQDMDANLFAHAMDLQEFEIQISTIVTKIQRINATFSILYPRNFDVRGFQSKIQRIMELQKAEYPSKTGMNIAWRSLTTELTSDQAEQAIINGEIEAAAEVEPEEKIPEPAPAPAVE